MARHKSILNLFQFFLILLLLISFPSCSPNKIEKVERAFYFWKSDESLHREDIQLCRNLGVEKLYLKFFEVNYSDELGAFPDSKVNFWRYGLEDDDLIKVVPVVYIRNNVFKEVNQKEIEDLAKNIDFLITKYLDEKFRSLPQVQEYQIDCDWTLTTKDNYFYFLKKLKSISNRRVSCTLRLYPYKFPDKMGVPPVDRATLMCYNLINPLENPDLNSILDISELKKYLHNSKKYPLHLDFALPVYSWGQLYHDNNFSGLLYTNIKAFENIFKKVSPLWYSVQKDTVINEQYLRVGDRVKYEEIDAEKVNSAIVLLKKYVSFDAAFTVTLFHLDLQQLKNFTHEALTSFYTDFTK